MKKKSKEKLCKTCGRVITNPNNKSGVCSTCKGKGVTFIGMVVGPVIFIKKFGPKVVNYFKIVFHTFKR